MYDNSILILLNSTKQEIDFFAMILNMASTTNVRWYDVLFDSTTREYST